jgi:hypothetical protein
MPVQAQVDPAFSGDMQQWVQITKAQSF